MPKVSVVLPTYNGSKYLKESIESVVNQTFTDWELIIINDCSRDNTLEIANSYAEKDNRIKVFTNLENLKVPKSLNEGFKRAEGKYYTWTSDDNMYKQEAFSVLTSYLDENPSTDMVYSDFSRIDSSGQFLYDTILDDPDKLPFGDVVGASFMYRSDIAKKVGEYDISFLLAQDYEYWIRIYRKGKISHICDNLYYYRNHKESQTEIQKDFVDEETFKVLEKHFFWIYTSLANHKEQELFFDHVMQRVGNNHVVLKRLRRLKPFYRFFK